MQKIRNWSLASLATKKHLWHKARLAGPSYHQSPVTHFVLRPRLQQSGSIVPYKNIQPTSPWSISKNLCTKWWIGLRTLHGSTTAVIYLNSIECISVSESLPWAPTFRDLSQAFAKLLQPLVHLKHRVFCRKKTNPTRSLPLLDKLPDINSCAAHLFLLFATSSQQVYSSWRTLEKRSATTRWFQNIMSYLGWHALSWTMNMFGFQRCQAKMLRLTPRSSVQFRSLENCTSFGKIHVVSSVKLATFLLTTLPLSVVLGTLETHPVEVEVNRKLQREAKWVLGTETRIERQVEVK